MHFIINDNDLILTEALKLVESDKGISPERKEQMDVSDKGGIKTITAAFTEYLLLKLELIVCRKQSILA